MTHMINLTIIYLNSLKNQAQNKFSMTNYQFLIDF